MRIWKHCSGLRPEFRLRYSSPWALGFMPSTFTAGLPDTSLDNRQFLLDRRTFFSQTAASRPEGQAQLNESSVNASRFRREHRKSYPRSLCQGSEGECATISLDLCFHPHLKLVGKPHAIHALATNNANVFSVWEIKYFAVGQVEHQFMPS